MSDERPLPETDQETDNEPESSPFSFLRGWTRRNFLTAGVTSALGAVGFAARRALAKGDEHYAHGAMSAESMPGGMAHGGMGTVGTVDTTDFDPMVYLTTWNFNDLPPAERGKFYRETLRPDGSLLREYELIAIDKEIEIAPGVFFPAWTYNGQVPGPTIRATEGDRLRIRFLNQGSHPHTIHFHGWHTPAMDGAFADQFVNPGDEFLYEFDADPVGVHLYHCHSNPLKRHIHKGLYGAYIVDPKTPRPDAQELVMMMNGFDTNFDGDNEIYAVNTVGHHYMQFPIKVEVGKPVRVYLINITEFDLINSFHLHAAFFDVYRTGTRLHTDEFTDTVMLSQAERVVLEFTLRYPGSYMFHAHQSEFAELGWMGVIEAVAPMNA
ncbi:MAG: multicopper oxidase domain-containing protein [Candidatus Poribacteria bacterium]|nr:multicopper oxidase domain-containing protein [Candidatus Poribacteria bacterium]